jgi:hypothetical protein
VLLKSILFSAVGFYLFFFIPMVIAASPGDVCNLPEGLQREIAIKYPGAKLVSLSDLGEDNRGVLSKRSWECLPRFGQR